MCVACTNKRSKYVLRCIQRWIRSNIGKVGRTRVTQYRSIFFFPGRVVLRGKHLISVATWTPVTHDRSRGEAFSRTWLAPIRPAKRNRRADILRKRSEIITVLARFVVGGRVLSFRGIGHQMGIAGDSITLSVVEGERKKKMKNDSSAFPLLYTRIIRYNIRAYVTGTRPYGRQYFPYGYGNRNGSVPKYGTNVFGNMAHAKNAVSYYHLLVPSHAIWNDKSFACPIRQVH